MFYPKKCGKTQMKVFLDIFSPSENDSEICLSVKNLVPMLLNLSYFAIWHCILSSILSELYIVALILI